MCLACEMAFFDMVAATEQEARERPGREQEEAARFVCEAAPPASPQGRVPPAEDGHAS